MAELDVQPKKKSPWWLWLLLALIVLGLIFYFLSRNDNDTTDEREVDEPETGAVYSAPEHMYAAASNASTLYLLQTA